MNSIAQEFTLRHPLAGPINGLIDENGALCWRGIPYAQAPVGELRWKAPRALNPFTSVFTADAFADFCTQLGHPLLDIHPSRYGKAVGSEDCLYLNIWSPMGMDKPGKTIASTTVHNPACGRDRAPSYSVGGHQIQQRLRQLDAWKHESGGPTSLPGHL